MNLATAINFQRRAETRARAYLHTPDRRAETNWFRPRASEPAKNTRAVPARCGTGNPMLVSANANARESLCVYLRMQCVYIIRIQNK